MSLRLIKAFQCATTGTLVYYATTCITLMGFWYGWKYVVTPYNAFHRPTDASFLDSMLHWDGRWYLDIASTGYEWIPGGKSSVAFFPLYPAIASAATWATRLDIRLSLLAVSHLCLLLGLIAMQALWMEKAPNRGSPNPPDPRAVPLESGLLPLLFAISPMAIFCRAAYTESLFVLIATLILLGMRKGWNIWSLALLTGCLTATRSVGVAMVPALLWHGARIRSANGVSFRPRAVVAGLVYTILCLSGLIVFMSFQYGVFGSPFAFMDSQTAWRIRPPADPLHRAVRLITLAPIIDVYSSTGRCAWYLSAPHSDPLFNAQFWNPIYFIGACLLLGTGTAARLLSAPEALFGWLCVLIPYVLNGDTHCMMSHARFTAVNVPAYIVIAKGVSRSPPFVQCIVVSIFGAFHFLFASGFTADYWIF